MFNGGFSGGYDRLRQLRLNQGAQPTQYNLNIQQRRAVSISQLPQLRLNQGAQPWQQGLNIQQCRAMTMGRIPGTGVIDFGANRNSGGPPDRMNQGNWYRGSLSDNDISRFVVTADRLHGREKPWPNSNDRWMDNRRTAQEGRRMTGSRCEVCGKILATDNSLTQHFRSRHLGADTGAYNYSNNHANSLPWFRNRHGGLFYSDV